MSVETLFHFRVGGELKWTLIGAGAGALVSVTPGQLMCFWSIVALVLLAWAVSPPRAPRFAHLLSVFAFGAVVTAAIHAPTKAGNQRVRVSAQTMPLSQLASELELGEPLAEGVVALPSTRPTWDEVEQAIETQTTHRVRQRGCGFGASLLTGSAVLSRHLEPR